MMSYLSFQSDIYFKATAAVSGSSVSSSKEMSSRGSPQTPTAYEMPEYPLSSLEGNMVSRQLEYNLCSFQQLSHLSAAIFS